MKKIVWRWDKEGTYQTIYGFLSMHFRDQLVAYALEVTNRIISDTGEVIVYEQLRYFVEVMCMMARVVV